MTAQGASKREDDLDDGAVLELLFGWFDGWSEQRGKESKEQVVEFNPLFPLFLFLTNYLYLEILLIQSLLIRFNYVRDLGIGCLTRA